MKGFAIMAMVMMTACAAPGPAPMPLAASGPVAVTEGGMNFIVDLQPTAGGAQMTVSAEAGALAMDQGLIAKKAAVGFCAGRGMALSSQALGRFVAGSWVFNGGCA